MELLNSSWIKPCLTPSTYFDCQFDSGDLVPGLHRRETGQECNIVWHLLLGMKEIG